MVAKRVRWAAALSEWWQGRAQRCSRQRPPGLAANTPSASIKEEGKVVTKPSLTPVLLPYCRSCSCYSELNIHCWYKIFTLCISQTMHEVFFFHVGSKPFSPYFLSSLESSLFKYRIFPWVFSSAWFWHMFESISWEEKKKITPEPLLREGVINDLRLIENVCSRSSNWAPLINCFFTDFVTLQNLFGGQRRGKDHLISLQNLYKRNSSFFLF